MLPEILTSNLTAVFVGTAVGETSDELGFYYLGPNNKFWYLLEYAGITSPSLVSTPERKVLINAKRDGVLNDAYKQLFFEKKESQLLKYRIGVTDLNRRLVVSNDDDPAASPTDEDIQKFVGKVEKYRPKIVGFVTSLKIFEKSFKPLYPSATGVRGKQDFLIGDSEVWLLGSTSGRVLDTDAMEQVFEDLAQRMKEFVKTTPAG